MSATSSHDTHNSATAAGPAHHGEHETSDISFNRSIWLIPISMVLLILYAYICWFGASKTLKREIASKQVPDSTAAGGASSSGTP
jgi:hypothetical protein